MWVLLVVLALAVAWILTGGVPADVVTAAVGDARAVLGGQAAQAPHPTADVVALAGSAYMSDEGRKIFYATRPEILDAAAFAGRCGTVEVSPATAGGGFVGCYRPGQDTIIVYRPADPRLAGQAVVTAAHETLHAVWTRLSPADRNNLTPILVAAEAAIPADDDIHTEIAGSVGTHPENRPTELFAYLGTQVDGLDPRLEQVYARYFTDRTALVAVHTSQRALMDGMVANITAASHALTDTETANAQARAQLTADMASRDNYRRMYQAKVDEVAAMSADQRSRLRLSWVWWDGTKLPMAQADTTLAAAAALLARDDAALPARDATITSAEASAAAESTRIDGLVADFNALQKQLDPTAPAG